MSWMVAATQLDSEQRDFLNRVNKGGNYWIKGFAGSGKSILLVHSLIQAKVDNPKLNACVVLYTRSLIDMFRTGIPDLLRDVSVITYSAFKKNPKEYDLILVDEVQDLPADVLISLKKHCKRLIVAGDSAQSIYTERVAPEQIADLAGATSYELTILHRLTNKIIEIAKAIFPEKRLESAKKSRLKNVEVMLGIATEEKEEVRYVWENASNYASPGVPAAILFPNQHCVVNFVNSLLNIEGHNSWSKQNNQYNSTDFGAMNEYLSSCKLNLQYLGNNYGSLKQSASASVVYLMNYHSAKGLDFQTVFLPMLNSRTQIWSEEDIAKNLFFVALTRSRLNLFLTYTGKPHPYVEKIPKHLLRIIELPLKKKEVEVEDDSEEFLF